MRARYKRQLLHKTERRQRTEIEELNSKAFRGDRAKFNVGKKKVFDWFGTPAGVDLRASRRPPAIKLRFDLNSEKLPIYYYCSYIERQCWSTIKFRVRTTQILYQSFCTFLTTGYHIHSQ